MNLNHIDIYLTSGSCCLPEKEADYRVHSTLPDRTLLHMHECTNTEMDAGVHTGSNTLWHLTGH